MPGQKPYYAWIFFGAAMLCSILAIAYTFMTRPTPVVETSSPSSPVQVMVPAWVPKPAPPPPPPSPPAAKPAGPLPVQQVRYIPVHHGLNTWWTRWDNYNRWHHDDLHWGRGHRWDWRTDPWDHPNRWRQQKQCVCASTSSEMPVCKGQRQWASACLAKCDGVNDAGPCSEVRQVQK